MKRDYVSVLGAYTAFGLLPVFWALLSHVDPMVVLLSRTVFSMVFLGIVMLLSGGFRESMKPLRNRRYLCGVVVSAALLATNWGTYLVALQRGELFSASLAYYLAPLMTVVASAFLLGERLSAVKKAAACCLALGVAVPVIAVGQFPMFALVIGGSWVGYTLVRRAFKISPVQGLFHETAVLTAAVALVAPFCSDALVNNGSGFSVGTWLLLAATGPITAIPLLALSFGMRSVPMQAVGVMQYVAPTMKLLLSVAYYKTYPSTYQAAGLVFIWMGIVVFFAGESALVRHLKSFIIKHYNAAPRAIPFQRLQR